MDPWTPLGQLLLDYLEGAESAEAAVIWEDGGRSPLPASAFFRMPAELPDVEVTALELCRGRVLDVGAGAGCHALSLQKEKIVRALDVCPLAVEVMERRGVKDARLGDVFSETSNGYDTLLLLMNGIGLVGDLGGLERFFAVADRLLAPAGQIVLDSSDLRMTDDVRELGRLVERVRMGRYRGETRQRIEYGELLGDPFEWLFLDGETLAREALRSGWQSQIVYEGTVGEYLARLVRI